MIVLAAFRLWVMQQLGLRSGSAWMVLKGGCAQAAALAAQADALEGQLRADCLGLQLASLEATLAAAQRALAEQHPGPSPGFNPRLEPGEPELAQDAPAEQPAATPGPDPGSATGPAPGSAAPAQRASGAQPAPSPNPTPAAPSGRRWQSGRAVAEAAAPAAAPGGEATPARRPVRRPAWHSPSSSTSSPPPAGPNPIQGKPPASACTIRSSAM